MSAPVAVDEIGRFYICDEDGNPYAGPFDTLEEAEARQAAFDDEDEDCDAGNA